jgi:hypothetical protein
MSGWLKAGLIGMAIIILLNILGLVPLLVCITLPLTLVAYCAIGVMAAVWMTPPRTVEGGAGQGAIAALIASLGGGIVNLVIVWTQASSGGMQRYLSQMPPEIMRQIQQSDIPMDLLFGTISAAIGGTCCCALGMVFAAALGAAGGAIYASTKREA